MKIPILLLWCAILGAQTQTNPVLPTYLTGLDALRQGRYADATIAFNQAMQGGSDPSFWLARGVSDCLSERF